MSSGYVLNFSDRTFGEFVFEAVGIDIHEEKYASEGTSKAKKLRAFWKFGSDYIVGTLLLALIDCDASLNAEKTAEAKALADTCRQIATRLLAGSPSLNQLKELTLVPEGVPDAARGADVIKRLLSNLGTIGNGLAELRGLYGTGHGKHGSATGLGVRHAKLAVGAAATLTVFLFEIHKETKP